MPHKKGKKKTIPKHKKKGVKIIANHKICPDNQPTYKKRKNITNNPKKGIVSHEPLMQQNNKNIITNKKHRLPIEVMPSSSNNGSVRIIDNLPELKPSNTAPALVNSSNPNISISSNITNLTQAKKIREQVWVHHNGKKFECKCYVVWCTNTVDVFNFQVGHDTPKALGGSNELLNLKPICQNCNQSMGSRYSIAEWNQLFTAQRRHISTMISRQNSNYPDNYLSDYEKIDLGTNTIDVHKNINNQIELPASNMQTQMHTMRPTNLSYGPLARFMTTRTNRPSVVQSALGMIILLGTWFYGG
jgi:hypothetical protein